MWQALIDAIVTAVTALAGLLPDSPFIGIESGLIASVMGYLNYFVPVGRMIVFMSVYLTAAIGWYAVRWAMRVGQMID